MGKREELTEFLHGELDNIYCYNCRHQNDPLPKDDCDFCHRKSMGWQVSDAVIERAVEIAMSEEK